jgi:mannose-6-phosphate isomerase-like protein (cupin superfamily)
VILKNIYEMELVETIAHRGEGLIKFGRPFSEEDFSSPWHFVDYAIIPPGCSIGEHQHGANEEMYFILHGEGKMIVNGKESTVRSGDLVLNKSGWSHGLRNESAEDIRILVVEVGLIS